MYVTKLVLALWLALLVARGGLDNYLYAVIVAVLFWLVVEVSDVG